MTQLQDLGQGIYRIIAGRAHDLVQSCPYLIQSGEAGVLIDPGGSEGFEEAHSLVSARVSADRIPFIVLTSEAPDACASLPQWARAGFRGKVLIDWKAYQGARQYGWDLDTVILRSPSERFMFGDARELILREAPGLPGAGSLFCFDPDSRSLFSGALFGSIGGREDGVEEASPGCLEAYHELCFPYLGPRPDLRRTIAELDPERFLSRCGPPIREYRVQALKLLAEAEQPALEGDAKAGPSIVAECNRRLVDLFSMEELAPVLRGMDLGFDEDLEPEFDDGEAADLLERYCDSIAEAKGALWLSLIQPTMARRIAAAGLRLPRAFERYAPEMNQGLGGLVNEVRRLKTEKMQLQKSIIQATEDRLKDPITGFYNEAFFEEYLESLLPPDAHSELPKHGFAFLRLDRISQLNQRFGAKAGDATLKGLAIFLLNHKWENTVFFRLNGPLFACCVQGAGKAELRSYAEHLMAQVAESEQFVDTISISSAIMDLDEVRQAVAVAGKIFSPLMKVAKERIRLLDRLGPGSLCDESEVSLRRSSGTVLIIEGNRFEGELFASLLERRGFEAHVVCNGNEALARADLHRPDVVVCEVFVPQMDGFQIRARLLASQDLRRIPFILVSREKDDVSVQRALDLGIKHYFRKPLLASELSGLIKLLLTEAEAERHP